MADTSTGDSDNVEVLDDTTNLLDDITATMLDEDGILDDPTTGVDEAITEATPAIATDPTTAVDEAITVAITEATPAITTPPSISKKRGVPTTARTTASSKKKKASAQCRKGARVKITRSLLFHILEHDEQREKLKGYGNSRNFFGRILSGSGKTGYSIRFDDLPAGYQDVHVKIRILITVLEDGEEEKETDHTNQLAKELAEIRPPTATKEAPAKSSTDKFCALDTETIAAATIFGLNGARARTKW